MVGTGQVPYIAVNMGWAWRTQSPSVFLTRPDKLN
jgi:hypothetical protein